MMKKTKIVCTIGPATESEEMMTKLVKAGMNVVRLNLTHGTHDEHGKRIDNARKISKKLNTPVAVLFDLLGPKIRIGEFKTERVNLVEGKKIILTTDECAGTAEKVSINYSNLPKEIKPKQIIFIDDGRVKLEVDSIKGTDIICKILVGAEIKGKRGLNIPGAYLSMSCLTEKDKRDLEFGVSKDVDFMAISFVRRAADIKELRDILDKKKVDIQIISKVETLEACENIDEIIAASDAIMVARGDLAVEIPAEEVPIVQKMIINKCNAVGKPVITATQMLLSMVNSPVPTRAEISDVANSILDGTDAVMLSEETTLGKYPIEAVDVMSRVAIHTEKHFYYEEHMTEHHLPQKNITDSVGCAVVNTAREIKAKCIVALSVSGFTARMVTRYRPRQPILVLTPSKKTYNRLALSHNCTPVLTEMFNDFHKTIDATKMLAVKYDVASKGDNIVIVAGLQMSKPGNTNILVVETISK